LNAIQKRIDELSDYAPAVHSQPDFAAFWEDTLADNQTTLNFSRTPVETPLKNVDAYKVVYEGYAQTPIHAWYLVPPTAKEKASPCLVMFHGYSGSKREPEDYAVWLLMGFAVLAIDVRGQSGETGNSMPIDYGMTKGWITQGILDKHSCYYKALAIDGIRAVEVAKEQPETDSSRIIAMGSSQGGGMALLTTALEPSVMMCIADIPNMCQMDFGLFNSTGSLTEIAQFVSHAPERLEQVLTTLSYFDILNLADRITVPVWMSVGLKDTICLPETVFAAYNSLATKDKALQVNPFLGHANVRGHDRLVYDFMKQYL
jgi:cephalosporin-C deacetylase